MFNKVFKQKTEEVSKRSMTDDDLAHLISKIKHNLDILESFF